MTTHVRSNLGGSICGTRTTHYADEATCCKCNDAMRRVRAAIQRTKGVPHAPPAAVPQAADVNGGYEANSDNGVGAVTRAETCRAVGVGVVFGTASAPSIGTVVRKNPEVFAFRYSHIGLATAPRGLTSKHASPTQPAWT